MDRPDGAQDQASTGLFAGIGAVTRNLFALLITRLELAALELGEARDHLARTLLVGAVGVLLMCFALAGWSVLIVLLAWDSMGWMVVLLLAGAYTLLGICTLLYARALLKRDALSMPATMAELRSDRDALF